MSASLPGDRELPRSQYDLSTYFGRVQHAITLTDPSPYDKLANLILCSTLFAGQSGLENAKQLVTKYKTGELKDMTPELWNAKKIVDSTLHPGMCRPTNKAANKTYD
ncbi:hypothetical protein LLEC1_01360 [Akanthomyces lecanii]|uniref:Uncharacterized protein n=1 Tax=Cordyceps confragosa TaxID=2714763 RepID=A0A179IFB6_CORDF|nr:hypothetical protein LLEC1_01360 [Akanthomyces lecanii]